jgi:hypothetical protein
VGEALAEQYQSEGAKGCFKAIFKRLSGQVHRRAFSFDTSKKEASPEKGLVIVSNFKTPGIYKILYTENSECQNLKIL